MSNFRYIRMAGNDQGWKRPHGGRMGGDDYVGTQGLGHEDWNFSKDVWKDGRYHLYLRSTPAGFKDGKFNFVLGAHAHPAPLVIGFVEKATYGLSTLPKQVLLRRAREIFALNADGSLGSIFGKKSVEEIAKRLMRQSNDFNVSVAPKHLHILSQPVPMPTDIYRVSHPAYRALSMTIDEYKSIKERVLSNDTIGSVDQLEEASFPEGRLIEKLHKSRERSQGVVKLAKRQFIDRNGRLYCEACGLEPEQRFSSNQVLNRVIEAHHDRPLSDSQHVGVTRPSELKMVCPTCHRAIHTIRPWLSVEKLKRLLNSGN